MKDAEIMKALQCCTENNCTHDCPFYYDSCIKCRYSSSEIISLAFGLINRQKAEMERLQKAGEEAVSCFTRMESLYKIKCKELEVAKTEAVKKLVGRVKQEINFPLAVWKVFDSIVTETVGAE